MVKEKCLAKCEDLLKGGDCEAFCRFVDHLYTHDPAIYTQFSKEYKQDAVALVRGSL
jgi:hypothetical protein